MPRALLGDEWSKGASAAIPYKTADSGKGLTVRNGLVRTRRGKGGPMWLTS